MVKWLKDPEGYEFRFVVVGGDRHVEYKPIPSKRPTGPFKRFVVKFQGEEWHVSAPSAEGAMRIFASEFLRTSPHPGEVTVEEVECK